MNPAREVAAPVIALPEMSRPAVARGMHAACTRHYKLMTWSAVSLEGRQTAVPTSIRLANSAGRLALQCLSKAPDSLTAGHVDSVAA